MFYLEDDLLCLYFGIDFCVLVVVDRIVELETGFLFQP